MYKRQALASVEDEDLAPWCPRLARHPELLEAPATLAALLEWLVVDERGEACLDRATYLAVFVATYDLRLAANVAQSACNGASCPAYTGVVVCVPTPPSCSFMCPVAGVAHALVAAGECVLGWDDTCGLRNHYELVEAWLAEMNAIVRSLYGAVGSSLIPALDLPLSSRASHAGLNAMVSSVDGGLDAADEEVRALASVVGDQAGSDAAHQDLAEQLGIEESLQLDQGAPVGLQLPERFGGRLETVRSVVAAAIQMNLAAAQDVHGALEEFDRGDAAYGQEQYLVAFEAYRAAYREAARE